MRTFDAVVIGGGPAGMTAALYLLRSGVTTALVEKLSPGGQVLLTETIENYPGFPDGLKGYELADLFEKQLDKYGPEKIRDEVMEIVSRDGAHEIRVGQEWIKARAVVICSGARYRRMGIPGEEKFIGRGVSYCALCDGNFYREGTVAVIGGGNSALEESLYLSRLVKKLYLVHRRDDFRGERCYQDKCVVTSNIEILRSHVLKEVLGDDSGVTGLLLEDLKTKTDKTVKVDGVFILIGFEPVGEFLPKVLERDSMGFLITSAELSTNIPGIFAAGDIRSKACRQVASAVGDGAVAAHSAMSYLEQHDA